MQPKIQEHFQFLHGVIGVYLTNRCNMKCRHCSVSSGPEENSRLRLEGICDQIRHLKQATDIRGIHVSGGEPFLYPDDIGELAKLGSELVIPVAVATNASWATSEYKAKSILSGLAGLTQLLLSCDEYHLEYAPLQRVIYAARAAIALGLHVTINVCRPHGRASELEAALQNALDCYFPQCEIAVSDLELGGRADGIQEAHWREIRAGYPSGSCRQLNRPVILENRSVLGCCNTTVAPAVSHSPLLSEQLQTACDLTHVLEQFKASAILQAIRIFGPAFLANRLSDASKDLLPNSYVDGDICGLCKDMLSRPAIVHELGNVFENSDMREILRSADVLLNQTYSSKEENT